MEIQPSRSADFKDVYYPPGGILIWMIIFLELSVFGIALIVLAYYSTENPDGFHKSRLLLNPAFGVVNTILLLTSGYYMATSIKHFRNQNQTKVAFSLSLTILGGLLFLLLKSIEYSSKIGEGLTFGYDTFFNFYWLLTGFHVIHVMVGLVILSTIYFQLKKGLVKLEDFEAGAAFWHMCDLIWLLLFPMLYLVL